MNNDEKNRGHEERREGRLEGIFPNLKAESYKVTSPKAGLYNCIAWAAGEDHRWWRPASWPYAYWPSKGTDSCDVEAFIEAFTTLGYERCADNRHEKGFEKVAIYVGADNKPTHAARQLPNGRWTSKLGELEDIDHDFEGLEGEQYGKVQLFLKRPFKS